MKIFDELREKCPWHDTYPADIATTDHEQEHECKVLANSTYGSSCKEENCAVWHWIQRTKNKAWNVLDETLSYHDCPR